MAKKFCEPLEKMPQDRRQRIEQRTSQLMADMPTQELCKALKFAKQQANNLLAKFNQIG